MMPEKMQGQSAAPRNMITRPTEIGNNTENYKSRILVSKVHVRTLIKEMSFLYAFSLFPYMQQNPMSFHKEKSIY